MLRRTVVASAAAAFAVGGLPVIAEAANESAHALAKIELRSGGRLGVHARVVGTGRAISYRASERFPMCSTFKVLAVAAVLNRVDRDREHLERYISYRKADLQAYAPVTTEHVAEGKMTIAELCRAAIVLSDNTAANLLLRTIGGPAGITAFVRAHPLNDNTTRLDRDEPTLNSAIPGDSRDTTTPSCIVSDLAILLTSDAALTTTSSRMLERWMHNCQTGTTALRAGAASNWYAGDKTGSGDNGTRNDLAIFRPPRGAPVIVAAYLTGAGTLHDDARNAILADVGRVVTRSLS